MEKIITIVGTTASGKSDLGIYLAKKFDGEIVSCDSRQVYKGLDLGTGKVTAEEQAEVRHHLLDIVEPNEKFSLAEYQKLAYSAINDILARGGLPFLVGGTGLYSRAVTQGYNLSEEEENPELREKINAMSADEIVAALKNAGEAVPEGLSPRHLARRLEKAMKGVEAAENSQIYDYLQLIPVFPRDVLYNRIEKRLDARLAAGMVDEVRTLKEHGATDEFLERLGLEYRYTNRFLGGVYSFDDYRDTLLKEIRHFAKRQITWFKKERNAVDIDMTGDYLAESEKHVKNFLKNEKNS